MRCVLDTGTFTVVALAAVLAAVATVATGAAAQSPTSAVLARGDSLAAAGDTAGALAALQASLRQIPADATLWHRLGLLASERSRPAWRHAFVRDQRMIDLLFMADSALYRATVLAPDSARYAIDYARHLIQTTPAVLTRALSYLDRARAAAEHAGDNDLLAEAFDAVGMVHWRRYEQVANRRALIGVEKLNFAALVGCPHDFQDFWSQHTAPFVPPLGMADYQAASAAFRDAMAARPGYPKAFRHSAMALAERGDWPAVRALADAKLTVTPWDAWGWLARGLASHGVGDDPTAAAAFDSALAYLAPTDRDGFVRLSRILRAPDSARVAAIAPAARAALERTFWLTADPMTLLPGNVYRTEFLSRVAFAELRWSVDELGLHGADSDRGDIYARYGPPPVVGSFPPVTDNNPDCVMVRGALKCEGVASVAPGFGWIVWYYPTLNLHFVFRAPPTYGTATLAALYNELAAEAREKAPVSWVNLPIARHPIDTIHVQVARFRAAADSSDVVVFAAIPTDQLSRGTAGRPVILEEALSLYTPDGIRLFRDSAATTSEPGGSDDSQMRAWRARVASSNGIVYRVEALRRDSLFGARALGETRIQSGTGFGVSDVLLAAKVQSRESAAERWTDLLITPSVGTVRAGSTVGVLWETYGLTPIENGVRYEVTLALARDVSSGAGGLAARIVGGVREAIGRSAAGRDGVALTYTRQTPARSALVDYVTLDLSGVPAGSYLLTLTVTDAASGRQASQRRALHMVK